MNPKFIVFAAFWAVVAIAIIGLPSCGTEEEQTADAEFALTQRSTNCSDFKTVPTDSAVERINYWQEYAQQAKIPSKWSITDLSKFDQPFTIQSKTIEDLNLLASGSFTGAPQIKVDSSNTMWLMMALEPAATTDSQTLTLHLVAYGEVGIIEDKNTTLLYFDIFGAEGLSTIDKDTAIAQINAAKPFMDAFFEGNPIFSSKAVDGPIYGLAFPLCDILDIAKDAPSAKNFQAMFVIKPDEDKPGQFRPDIYIKANLGEELGEDPYYDFTAPCPSFCPPPDTSSLSILN